MRSREMIKLVEDDGWVWVATSGSHRQYKHPTKRGRVTIKHPDSDIPIKTIKSILSQAGLK